MRKLQRDESQMRKHLQHLAQSLCLGAFFVCATALAAADSSSSASKKDAPDVSAKSESTKDAAPAAAATPAEEVVPDPPATPLPRFIKAPEAIYVDTDAGGKEVTVDYKKSTFTVVGVLATWNARSAEVAMLLNKNFDKLRSKNISIVTLFSHDTKFTLKEWKKINKPKFQVGIASINFIDEQKNPKVPSFWSVDNKGRLIKFLETPANTDIEGFLNQLDGWTDF